MHNPIPEQLVCQGCGAQAERDEELELLKDGCYLARYKCQGCAAEGQIEYDPAAGTTDREGDLFTTGAEVVADGGLDTLAAVLEDTPDPGCGSPTFIGRDRP